MKKGLPYLLLPALITLAVFSGCSYITGEVITGPISSPASDTTAAPQPWVCGCDNSTDISDGQTQQNIEDITPDKAFVIISTSEIADSPVIIDVRTPEEFASGYIRRGTLNIDIYSSTFREDISKLNKDKAYIVYCRTGGRSAAAVKIMQELGFNHVYNITGGITAWLAAGLPIVK